MDEYSRNRKAAAKFLRGLADIIETTDSLVEPITVDFDFTPPIIKENGEFISVLPPTERIARATITWDIRRGGIPMIYLGEDTHGTGYFISEDV